MILKICSKVRGNFEGIWGYPEEILDVKSVGLKGKGNRAGRGRYLFLLLIVVRDTAVELVTVPIIHRTNKNKNG